MKKNSKSLQWGDRIYNNLQDVSASVVLITHSITDLMPTENSVKEASLAVVDLELTYLKF